MVHAICIERRVKIAPGLESWKQIKYYSFVWSEETSGQHERKQDDFLASCEWCCVSSVASCNWQHNADRLSLLYAAKISTSRLGCCAQCFGNKLACLDKIITTTNACDSHMLQLITVRSAHDCTCMCTCWGYITCRYEKILPPSCAIIIIVIVFCCENDSLFFLACHAKYSVS